VLEFLGPVADAEDIGRSTLADDVQNGNAFGEPNGFVERQYHHQAQQQTLGAGRYRRRQDQR
jgi:hypothetical protein